MKKNNQFSSGILFVFGILILLLNAIFSLTKTLSQASSAIAIVFLVTGIVSFLLTMIQKTKTSEISTEKYQKEHPDERNRMLIEKSSHIMQGINLVISGVGTIIFFVLYNQFVYIKSSTIFIILSLFSIAQIICPHIIRSIIAKNY